MEILSEFGRIAAEIDHAELIAEWSPGGPADDLVARLRNLEEELAAYQPERPADHTWLANRLARAKANGWTEEAMAPLMRLVEPQ